MSPAPASASATTRRAFCSWVRPRPSLGRRRDRRDVVVAVDPRDLLGVVGRVDEVGAPRRRRHEHVRVVGALAGLVDRAAEVAQDADDALARVVDAHDARRLGDVEEVCRALRRAVDVGHAGVDGAAAVLDEQVDGELGGGRGHLRVDAALEALGRLGDEPVPARRARDRRRVEVRRLDEDVGRRVGRPREEAPPMTPAMASGCSPPSVMSRSSGCRVRSTSSRVVSVSPRAGPAHDDRAGRAGRRRRRAAAGRARA